MEDDGPGTDEILAAFRSRRKAGEPAGPDAPASATSPPPDPTAAEASTLRHDPDLAPAPTDGPDDWRPVRDEASTDAPAQPPSPEPAPMSRSTAMATAVSALRPAVQGGAGAVALSAGSPALNLSSRLLEDRFVARSGTPMAVATGIVLAVLGLGVALADQALLSRGTALTPFNTDLSSLGLVLAGVGLLAALLGLVLPRRRSVRVRLAATQREEWARVQAEARRLTGWSIAGGIVGLVGLAVAVAAYATVAQPEGGYVAGAFALLGLAGIGVLAASAVRRGLLQRLYVQTLVLSRLEQTGLGPAAERDPRLASVLMALDRLLGALPESAVRRFLHSDEALHYLELLDDLAGDRARGR